MVDFLHHKSMRKIICCCTGGYAVLVAQLQTSIAVKQRKAGKTIQALARRSQSKKDAVIAAAALPLLVTLLR